MSITVPLYGFGGGGGAALNFKVVGNPQPTSPKENTIWIDTDVPITGYYFAAKQPENMAEGKVWFATGTESAVEFNALKKNAVQVYPLSAKQHVSGALVEVTAMIYQGGEWISLARLPSEYQEVEFLQATGTQCIKSPLSGKLYMMRMELGIDTTGEGTFLMRLATGKPYFTFVTGSNATLSTAGTNITGATIPTNTFINLEMFGDSSGQLTVKMDGNQISSHNVGTSNAAYNYPADMWLFCRTDGSSKDKYLKGKVYYFRVYDTDHTTLLYDFVPCYRKADSVAGLFDMVNKVFYDNDGTGTFIVGGDV